MTRTSLVAAALLSLVACTGSADDVGTQAGAATTAPPSGTRVRILAANISSGNNQSYDSGEGQRILQGLKPDITLLQEVNYGSNSDADIRAFVTATFGAEFVYSRGASSDQIPNAVISRYPIVASGEWADAKVSNRGFQWAHIDLPGDHDLWAISVHLLTTSSGNRGAEGTELASQIKAQVPAGDYVVLGGDFNTTTRTEPVITALSGLLQTAGPFPADNTGNQNTSENRNKPHDWILASPALDALAEPVVIGAQSFANGLVFDSRVYTPLADVAPVRQGDSGSANMQHMAVVRDFALPFTAPAPSDDAGVHDVDAGAQSADAGTTAVVDAGSDVTQDAGTP